MTKNEKICLIVEAIVSAGYSDIDAFVNYITKVLPEMNDLALQYELEHVVGNTLELING